MIDPQGTVWILPWIEYILPFIAMVTYAINERMARGFGYLLEEVRVLREVYTETTGRKRIPFTIGCRRFLRSAQDRLPPPKSFSELNLSVPVH